METKPRQPKSGHLKAIATEQQRNLEQIHEIKNPLNQLTKRMHKRVHLATRRIPRLAKSRPHLQKAPIPKLKSPKLPRLQHTQLDPQSLRAKERETLRKTKRGHVKGLVYEMFV
jgi:hypothetical protein